MTSTSLASFSDSVPEALSCGGGESIAAIFFLFFGAKKLPKKPVPESGCRSSEGLDARGGIADAGSGFPVLGSTCVGLFALCRSLTIAIAYRHRWLDQCRRHNIPLTDPMTIQEIWMPCIDVARFHRNQVSHELVCRIEHLFIKPNDHGMEFLFQ